jgi:hypothetical protein
VSRTPDRWIVVPNWSRFQHYRTREAPWIKVYGALLHKPEYLDLSLTDRGLLHGLWLAYHETDGRLRMRDVVTELRCSPEDSLNIHRRMHRLNHAGFIAFLASKPLPLSLCSSDIDARARENGAGQAKTRRAAWLRNVAPQIPRERLAEAIADELGISDPAEVSRLVEQVRA